MKKILNCYHRVFVDMNMLSFILQQLLVEHLGFAFVADRNMNNLYLFALFVKWLVILYMLVSTVLKVISLVNN